MDLAFVDDVTEWACTRPARALALWGPDGADLVGRAVGLLAASATLGAARRFRVLRVALAVCGDLRALVISSGAAQLYAVPVDEDGALLAPAEGEQVEALDPVERVQVFHVMYHGRAACTRRAA